MSAGANQDSREDVTLDSGGYPGGDGLMPAAEAKASAVPPKGRTKRPRPTFEDGSLTRVFKFPSKTYPRSSYYVTGTEIIIRIKKARKKWKLVIPKKRIVSYRTNRWFATPRWIEIELTFTQASRLGFVERRAPARETTGDAAAPPATETSLMEGGAASVGSANSQATAAVDVEPEITFALVPDGDDTTPAVSDDDVTAQMDATGEPTIDDRDEDGDADDPVELASEIPTESARACDDTGELEADPGEPGDLMHAPRGHGDETMLPPDGNISSACEGDEQAIEPPDGSPDADDVGEDAHIAVQAGDDGACDSTVDGASVATDESALVCATALAAEPGAEAAEASAAVDVCECGADEGRPDVEPIAATPSEAVPDVPPLRSIAMPLEAVPAVPFDHRSGGRDDDVPAHGVGSESSAIERPERRGSAAALMALSLMLAGSTAAWVTLGDFTSTRGVDIARPQRVEPVTSGTPDIVTGSIGEIDAPASAEPDPRTDAEVHASTAVDESHPNEAGAPKVATAALEALEAPAAKNDDAPVVRDSAAATAGSIPLPLPQESAQVPAPAAAIEPGDRQTETAAAPARMQREPEPATHIAAAATVETRPFPSTSESSPPQPIGLGVVSQACRALADAAPAISIHFDYARASLDHAARADLDDFARRLGSCASGLVIIEGHADSDGDADRNRAVSLRRAEAVREHLAKAGARPERLSAIGFGNARPAVPNVSAANKRRNRRAVIVLDLPR